ncbi:MAG: hypothetical protein A2W19_11055 [Spirochaetes bacterium RBG_16_49_21]|nr:MAG: hypothetical protein A2W19_11055 [Spirochaetes bacterium RBG_16_49_21]
MKKTKILIISLLGIICIISITVGFVFFYPKALKHPDNPGDSSSPIEVNLQISDNVITMLNSTEDKIISAIGDASKLWSMFSTHSRLNVTFFGKNRRLEPFSYEDISCETQAPSTQQENENGNANTMNVVIKNEIIAPGQEDPDCTGPACGHIWSCERSGDKNEIQRFNIQLNLANFDIRAENDNNDTYNLNTLIAHHIGHAIGLSHCSAGDTNESCNAKLSSNLSDPPENSIMYKRVFPGQVVNTISDDDRNGVIALYGELTQNKLAIQNEMQEFIQKANERCPCHLPENETDSRYVLSADESNALAQYQATLAENNLNTLEKRKEYAHYYQNLHLTAYGKISIPAERYLLSGLNNMNGILANIPIERLNAMRLVIVGNIAEKKSIIDDFQFELDPRFYEFTVAELNSLIQIRKAIIDEISRR